MSIQENILDKYIKNIINNPNKFMPFFIIEGTKNLLENSSIIETIKNNLGKHTMSDFLFIKDLSSIIGKPHILKANVDKKNQFIKIDEKITYEDLGTREINNRLQMSPSGTTKIVLIEDINRMNKTSINAFLKTTEEMLKNRIVIATSTNISVLLPTIKSRAIVINSQNESNKILKPNTSQDIDLQDDYLEQIIQQISIGNYGKINLIKSKIQQYPDLSNKIKILLDNLNKNINIHTNYKTLLELESHGLFNIFIDGYIKILLKNNNTNKLEKLKRIKQIMTSNVGIEKIILYLLLD